MLLHLRVDDYVLIWAVAEHLLNHSSLYLGLRQGQSLFFGVLTFVFLVLLSHIFLPTLYLLGCGIKLFNVVEDPHYPTYILLVR